MPAIKLEDTDLAAVLFAALTIGLLACIGMMLLLA